MPVFVQVTVTSGKDATAELAIQRGPEPEHVNKYGEKYHGSGDVYH